jgi:hypothetical protein
MSRVYDDYDDCDDVEDLAAGRWRGQVASSTRGKRGQRLLRDLLEALEAMPVRALVSGELECPDGVCALGALGQARGIDLAQLDPDDRDALAKAFDVAAPLVAEITDTNDRFGATPEQRWHVVHAWVLSQIVAPTSKADELSNAFATPANDTREP